MIFNIKLTKDNIKDIEDFLDIGDIDIDDLLIEICDQINKQKEGKYNVS